MKAPALNDIISLCLNNAIKTIEAKEYFESVVSKFLNSSLEQNVYSLDSRAKTCRREIIQIYTKELHNTRRPNYGDECFRCTYACCLFAKHSYMVYTSLQLALAGKEHLTEIWKDKPSFRVCCIGGGPGSDALGLTKFLRDTGLVATNRLECSIFDLHREWADTWHMITQSNASDEFPPMTYFSGDMTRTGAGLSSDELLKVRSADVVSFVKFFSTVEDSIGKDSSRGNLLREIFTELKPGALVLYIDNCYNKRHTVFQNIAISGGVTDNLFERHTRIWMQSEARRSEVMTRFDQQIVSKNRPRKNYKLSVMLLKKPCDDTTGMSISTSPTLLHPEADNAFPERSATPMVTTFVVATGNIKSDAQPQDTGKVTMPLKVRCKPRSKCSCHFTPY